MRSMGLVRGAPIAFAGLMALLVVVGWSGVAGAQVALDSPNLPPEPDPPDCDKIVSQYVGIDVHALFPNGIDFSNPRHYCFQNVQTELDPLNGDEHEFFDSTVEGTFDDGSGPQVVELQGPVQIVVRGKGAAQTGSWQTEILSMDLSGDVGGLPVQIRVSPVQPSHCDLIVSHYLGSDVHALFPNGIDFSNPLHKCFENVSSNTDPGTGDETEDFDSTVEGTFDDGSGNPQPVVLTGPVTTVVRGKGGATTGSWQTEILSMDLSGDVGGVSIDIRESPVLASPGEEEVELG